MKHSEPFFRKDNVYRIMVFIHSKDSDWLEVHLLPGLERECLDMWDKV